MEQKAGVIRVVDETYIDMDGLGINCNSNNSTSGVEYDEDDENMQEKQVVVYANSLSSSQMKALTALSDAFLPSIDASLLTTDDSVLKLYATSASMTQTPQRVSHIYIYIYIYLKAS